MKVIRHDGESEEEKFFLLLNIVQNYEEFFRKGGIREDIAALMSYGGDEVNLTVEENVFQTGHVRKISSDFHRTNIKMAALRVPPTREEKHPPLA